jgi:hypothetical protein
LAAHGLYRKSGFSLIEAMLAVSIFTIGMLGLIPMVMYTIQGNMFGIRITKAASLCQDIVEDLKAGPYIGADLADATRGDGGYTVFPTAAPEYFDDYGNPSVAGQATFIRQWKVEERALPQNVKDIVAEVYWLDPKYGRVMTVRAGVTIAGRMASIAAVKAEE